MVKSWLKLLTVEGKTTGLVVEISSAIVKPFMVLTPVNAWIFAVLPVAPLKAILLVKSWLNVLTVEGKTRGGPTEETS